MSSKDRVLKILEENRDVFVSGASMAKELGLTRTSIWKAIESLRKEGYEISGKSKNGYHLEKTGDMLSSAGILRHLKTKGIFFVETRQLVTSTNLVLRDLSARGAPEGHVLAADAQTKGRGRQGRVWFSPPGDAVYFSLLLKPKIKADDAMLITAAAAVACVNAIESIYGVQVGIKWVNDLYLNGKKICGILTEATMDMESGTVDSVVLGIGINITSPAQGYPDTIKDIAGAITERSLGNNSERCRLIAAVLDNFWVYYMDLSGRGFLDEYRKFSILTGEEISVITNSETRKAVALEIDDSCGLVVRYENGVTDTLKSGEVSASLHSSQKLPILQS